MRPRPCVLLFVVALSCLPGGCGTLVNLTASPESRTTYEAWGPTACEPFGGVRRSALLGGCCFAYGIISGDVLLGPGAVAASVVILGVETPLSFAGDVLTLPVVLARQRGAPWATSWGDKAAPRVPPGGEWPPEDAEAVATLAAPLADPPAELVAPATPNCGSGSTDGTAPAAPR